ncbi:tenascin-N-like isoform X2 [Paramacrobiotus metropolitanus]|uniref:tenascin-N-like isoform X2 n=1 Tax=Paramacrobiotus metropolitanus TaxID=2943436 RepID=UPI0024460622|nr:tenascin-N-like isoform X2 [Paramacrobiotus metropolitanus]
MALTQCAVWRNLWRSSSTSASQLLLIWILAGFITISRGANLASESGDASDTSVSVTALIDRPEIVMETADVNVEFLAASAISEDNRVVNGNLTTGQRVSFRGLVGGTHYLIFVRMLQNRRNVFRYFERMTYPSPVIDIAANSSLTTTNSIMLEWFKPVNSRVQGYQILYQRDDDAGATKPPPDPKVINVSNASITSFNVTGLEAGAKYSFRMKSVVEDVSSVETAVTPYCSRPLKPSLIVQPLSVKLMLQIQRPSNATKYYWVHLRNLDVKDEPYFGATYEVRVVAVACDLLSEEVSQVVRSIPPAVIYSHSEVSQTSVRFLVHTSWKSKYSLFTRLVFAVDGMPPKYVLPNDEDRYEVEFTSLVPGTSYKIQGWTERGDLQSDKRFLEVQLKPNNVTALTATKITSNSIRITWEPSIGLVGNYRIDHNGSDYIFTKETAWTITGLRPSAAYAIFVKACNERDKRACSPALKKVFTTLNATRENDSTADYNKLQSVPIYNSASSADYILLLTQSRALLFNSVLIIFSFFFY